MGAGPWGVCGVRGLPRAARVLAAFAFAVALLCVAPPAHAASGDVIDSFTADYTVQPSGVLKVTETIVYRFGPSSGRHGITRTLITREPYDDDRDQVYGIDVQQVSSPSNAPDRYAVETDDSGDVHSMTLRIGDPNRTVSAPTATYVIRYTVTGAMRTSGTYDELYWDVTGFQTKAPTNKVAVTATVPGGAKDTSCFVGAAKATTQCTTQKIVAGTARFTENGLPAGQNLTIGVKIASGLVADPAPHLEPQEKNYGLLIGAAAFGVTTVGSVIGGIAYYRARGRDQRYLDVPPGMVPAPGAATRVGYSDPDLQIPVQFTPPRIPVAEAGLLVDGQVDHRETAATLVDLAVRGALVLSDTGKKSVRVQLVNPDLATAPHEMVFMTRLFKGRPPGTKVTLGRRGTLTPAHLDLVTAVRNQVTDRGWFRSVPGAAKIGGIAGSGLGFLAVVGFFALPSVLFLLPLAPIAITAAVVRSKLRRGQRTPDGRAICDQVEGFRTYLATAEADQLKFEEGEDIFSRYLPWAMVFDLADRWSQICAELVALGRIPDVQPYWYAGNFSYANFSGGLLYGSLVNAATPVPASTSSTGTGFGGGSSFSGGGFSGGGGGGGGTGSW